MKPEINIQTAMATNATKDIHTEAMAAFFILPHTIWCVADAATEEEEISR